MTETQILEFLEANPDFMTTNDIVVTILRAMGWLLVKGLNELIEVCKTLYDYTFGLVDITRWTGLEAFLSDFQPLIMAFLFLSIVVLGFLYMFGKNKKHNVFTSILIFAVVVTSSNYLFSQLNLWAITFKDAVVSDEGTSDGLALVNQNLFDLLYIDEQIGLENLNEGNAPQYSSLSESELSFINMSEVIDFNMDGLSDQASEILSKRMLFKGAGQSGLVDVGSGVLWTDFGNEFYYRYTFRFGTFFLSAIAILIIYICLAYKNTRIIYELFVSRILLTLKSADMSNNKKTVLILESIRDGYYALCFTAITLRSYFLFTDFLAGQEMNSLARAFIILLVAFCVIDGANIMQKLTGVDAGLSSMAGKMIAAYHGLRGGTQMIQQAKQMHMMRQQKDAMQEMGGRAASQGNAGSGNAVGGADGVNDPNASADTAGNFREMDQATSKGKEAGNEENTNNSQYQDNQAQNTESDHSFHDVNQAQDNQNMEHVTEDFSQYNSGEPGADAFENSSEETSEDPSGNFTENSSGLNEMEQGFSGDNAKPHQAYAQADENMQRMDQTLNSNGNQADNMKSGYEEFGRAAKGSTDEKKNMFQKWGEKTRGEQDIRKNNSKDRFGETNYGRKTEQGHTASKENGTTRISTEKIGKTTYVGGDGGSDKRFGEPRKKDGQSIKEKKGNRKFPEQK